MTSNIFNYIGIGNLDPAYFLIAFLVLIIILFILVIVQFSKISKMKKTYEKFMSGRNVKSMEKEIIGLFDDIDFLKTSFKKNSDSIKSIKDNLLLAYQKVGVVRYDAFREMGGELSFSIALLNDRNDGFIINSVHSTEGCYTYTKEIVGGESFISLGDEEREALNKAMNQAQTIREKASKEKEIKEKPAKDRPVRNNRVVRAKVDNDDILTKEDIIKEIEDINNL